MTAHAGYHYTTGRATATFVPDATAACRQDGVDTSVFFGADGERKGAAKDRREAAAKAICAGCPLRAACAAWSLSTRQEFGTYGGLTEDDRRAVWRANAVLGCGTPSARKRHAALGQTCRRCGVGYEPLPDLERAEVAA